jgi:hypothetical protein
VAPNGVILTVNGNNGLGIAITPAGQQVRRVVLDNTGMPPGAGALFGLADVTGTGLYFVDDASNTLNLFQ